jgi:arginase family enzyme
VAAGSDSGRPDDARAAIVGIPYAFPELPYAADLVPRHLRVASTRFRGGFLPEMELDPLAALNVVDYGDAVVDPSDLDGSIERVGQKVSEVIDAGAIPITIGGNAPVRGVRRAPRRRRGGRRPLGVVNLDEHGDNTRSISAGAHARVQLGRAVAGAAERGLWPLGPDRECAARPTTASSSAGFREKGATLDVAASTACSAPAVVFREALDAASSEGRSDVLSERRRPQTRVPSPAGVPSPLAVDQRRHYLHSFVRRPAPR